MYTEYVQHYKGYVIERMPRKKRPTLYRAYKECRGNGKHFVGVNGKNGYLTVAVVQELIDKEDSTGALPIEEVTTSDLNAIERIAIAMQGIMPSIKPAYVAKAAINAYVTATGKEFAYDYEVINGIARLLAPLFKPHKMEINGK